MVVVLVVVVVVIVVLVVAVVVLVSGSSSGSICGCSSSRNKAGSSGSISSEVVLLVAVVVVVVAAIKIYRGSAHYNPTFCNKTHLHGGNTHKIKNYSEIKPKIIVLWCETTCILSHGTAFLSISLPQSSTMKMDAVCSHDTCVPIRIHT
jgi:hypothetical protein